MIDVEEKLKGEWALDGTVRCPLLARLTLIHNDLIAQTGAQGVY